MTISAGTVLDQQVIAQHRERASSLMEADISLPAGRPKSPRTSIKRFCPYEMPAEPGSVPVVS
jgi:hypothetical protein